MALEALEGLNFEIAKNSFIRVRNLRYLELIHDILERKKRPEYIDDDVFLADIYAYQGKFAKAADLYEKTGNPTKALQMYSDLRMFDKAKQYMTEGDVQSARILMQKQAEWSKDSKDPAVMVDILMHAGEEEQAIDLMGKSGMHQRLIEKARNTDKADLAMLKRIAQVRLAIALPGSTLLACFVGERRPLAVAFFYSNERMLRLPPVAGNLSKAAS